MDCTKKVNNRRKVQIVYVDNTVELRNDLPDKLCRDFEELEEYYDAGDWLNFDLFFEAFEATVKAYYIAGKISMEDLTQIFRKYGIA